MWEWVSGQYGNLASVLGLAVSLWTVYVATGARKAAREARRAARQSSLAEDLGDIQRRSNMGLHFVSQGSVDVGRFVLAELRTSIHRLVGQWEEDLSEPACNRLLINGNRLDAVQRVLTRSSGGSLGEVERARIIDELQRLDAEFSELMGQGIRLGAGHD